MLGPADLAAWTEDHSREIDPPRSPAEESARTHRLLLARLACGRVLTPSEWRELRKGFYGR